MARPRRERIDPKKRAALIEAASRELAAHGYEGASLNRILAAAGMSKSSAYYYFDDKADLCATVVEDCWRELFGRVPLEVDALTAKTFWSALGDLYRAQFAFAEAKPWRWGTLKAVRGLVRSLAPDDPLLARFAPMLEWMRGLLHRGQALGVVRDDLPEGLLVAMVMALDGASDDWLAEHGPGLDPKEVERIADEVQATLRHVLAPPTRDAGR